jgi:hypothetical protein
MSTNCVPKSLCVVGPFLMKFELWYEPVAPAAADDTATESKKNVSDTTVDMAKLRTSSANMLNMAMTIVGNEPLHATWFLVCKSTVAVKTMNGTTITKLGTTLGTEQWCWEMSQPSAARYLKDVFTPLEDEVLLNEVGIYQTHNKRAAWSLPPATCSIVS